MKALKVLIAVLVFHLAVYAFSQPVPLSLEDMTREEIMKLSQDELLEMSMEDLMILAGKMGISIDELLNMKTTVASATTLTPRETPGIVSFITEEEIRYSGARDLIDVLRLVPGFDFGFDVGSVIGVGLRGNWVHEGKILMMVDGQPMNELNYYNIPFGNHFPVDQIRRIEIIRGPGSAIYGGNAELGVINIITKTAKDIQGVNIDAVYGQMQKSMGRTNLSASTGLATKNWDFSAKGFLGEANRTDQVFTEYIDDPENKLDFSKGGSEIKSRQFNVGASNEKFSFRMIYDDYRSAYTYYDYDSLENYETVNEFRTILGELKYKIKINEKLSITPRLNYKFSRPFYEDDYWRNNNINRYSGALILNYLAGKKTELVSGLDYYYSKGKCIGDSGFFYSTGTKTLTLKNFAAFAEVTSKIGKLHLIAGFRTENNSSYGWAFAPRIGFTGVFNQFHFKALISGAFRSPTIGNIDVADIEKIEPEKSVVTELELGYRINDNMFVTANFFDIQIKKSIVYFDTGWTPIIDWGYINAANSGSDGLEMEYKVKYARGYATVNYSLYTQAFRSLPDFYAVPGHENSALGLAQHKIGFYASYHILDNLSLSPSFNFFGRKYGYTGVDEEGSPVIGAIDPAYLVNLSITYENLFMKGLSVNLSVYDILNQKPPFAHTYMGYYSSYPGRSREILLKVSLDADVFNGK